MHSRPVCTEFWWNITTRTLRKPAHEAIRLCESSDGQQPSEVQPAIDRLRTVAARVCIPDIPWAIAEAAGARGVPWRRLSRSGVLQLGFGSRQRQVSHDNGVPGTAGELPPVDAELSGVIMHALAVPCTQLPEANLLTDQQLHRVLVVGHRLVAAVRLDCRLGPVEVTLRVDAAVAACCVGVAMALELDVAVCWISLHATWIARLKNKKAASFACILDS